MLRHFLLSACVAAPLCTGTIAAHADGSATLTPYESRLQLLMVQYGLAQRAAACNLRSLAWASTWDQGVSITQAQLAQDTHIASRERAAADERLRAIALQAYQSMPCEKLLNSPAMDALDRMQWRMTGGWH